MNGRMTLAAGAGLALAAMVGCATGASGGKDAACGCAAACACGAECACFDGRWAFDVPCGWAEIVRERGAYRVDLLWNGGSAIRFTDCERRGNRLFARQFLKTNAEGQNRYKIVEFWFDGTGLNALVHTWCDETLKDFGRTYGGGGGKRIPALGPAPDLSKVKYGEPIALIARDFSGWETMGTAKNFWTAKDGVLSNRIPKDGKGKVLEPGANIRTVRGDFEDFAISYDVRVPPNCNSGVYLRGIYELQVLDSYGKPVDCHNMAAPYGRITPTVSAEKPAGEWQHVDAILCERHVTVTLNGVKIVDNRPLIGVTGGSLTSDQFKPGPIYLQGDHSDADFRNMVLRPIVK